MKIKIRRDSVTVCSQAPLKAIHNLLVFPLMTGKTKLLIEKKASEHRIAGLQRPLDAFCPGTAN
jgi:hypothetical protein